MLEAFGEILVQVRSGRTAAPPEYPDEFKAIVEREAEFARERLAQEGRAREGWHFWHAPLKGLRRFTPHQLRDAAEEARRPNTGLPMGLVRLGRHAAEAAEDGVRMTYADSLGSTGHLCFVLEHWFLHEAGGLFLYRCHDGARYHKRFVSWTTRVWRIAESLEHCVELYRALGFELDIEVHFGIVHEGMENMPLTCTDPNRPPLASQPCTVSTVSSFWSGSLANLQARQKQIVERFSKELSGRFGFADVHELAIGGVYEEYKKSRV